MSIGNKRHVENALGNKMREGKPIALVTGGGRGIGRGIVLALARQGWSVAVNYYRSEEAARATCNEALALGSPVALPIQGDVGRQADHRGIVEAVISGMGVPRLLVNNAAISSPIRGDLLDVTEAAWDQVLATNLKGPFFLTQAVARVMAGNPVDDDGIRGFIINISSISAAVPSIDRAEYCISKAGLAMMTSLLSCRLASDQIRVMELRPGIMKTDMTLPAVAKYDQAIAGGLTPVRRWGEPADVGKAVAALVSGSFPFTTGDVWHVDGGFHLRQL